MMKYHSKFNLKQLIAGCTVLVLAGMFNLPLWQIASAAKDSILNLRYQYSDDVVMIAQKNKLLYQQLVQTTAENIRLQLRLDQLQDPVSQVQPASNILDEEGQSIENTTQKNTPEIENTNQNFGIYSNLPYQIVSSGYIDAVPLLNIGNSNTFSASISNPISIEPNSEYYVIYDNYIIGSVISASENSVQFQPFNPSQNIVTAVMTSEEQVPVRLQNWFNYQIKIPNNIEIYDGLFESKTGLLLGIKTTEEVGEVSTTANYVLPWQPSLFDSIQIARVLPEVDEDEDIETS